MPRLLSLDPGHTTGIAIMDDKGKLKFSMTVPVETVYEGSFLNNLVRMAQPDIVLIEGLPAMSVDPVTQHVWIHFSHWFEIAGYKMEVIQPSQWKSLVERVKIPGQHARDAATMAKWYLRQKGV